MDYKIIELKVPLEMVLKSSGFGLDIGGSLLKVVFRTKEDLEEAKKGGDIGTLHAISVPQPQWSEAITYVKSNFASISDSPVKLFNTGVGAFALDKDLREQLKTDITNIGEFDCFNFAFRYLTKHLSRNELLHPFLSDDVEEAFQYSIGLMKQSRGTFDKGETRRECLYTPEMDELIKTSARGALRAGFKEDSDLPLEVAEKEGLYPYMIAVAGSAAVYFKIYEDGTFSLVKSSPSCGRALLGLGTLLTGCKDYNELLDLASRGSEENIYTGMLDLILGSEADGMYADLLKGLPNVVAYSFGKAVGADPGSFSREDIAMATVRLIAREIAQSVVGVANVNQCKRVFFAGSLVNSELVRKTITKDAAAENTALTSLIKQDDPQSHGVTIDFIKDGGYIGALGCILNTLHPFLPVPKSDK